MSFCVKEDPQRTWSVWRPGTNEAREECSYGLGDLGEVTFTVPDVLPNGFHTLSFAPCAPTVFLGRSPSGVSELKDAGGPCFCMVF